MSVPPKELDALRRRVRADPGSRYFLGLAEELMRTGERDEALAVLDAGLGARPGHLAAMVAKARCLVELGRPAEARPLLEAVLAKDPTHLVAAKLSIEVWLAQGDPVGAGDSLDRYAALGAADPDLPRLRSRVGELAGALAPSAVAGAAPPDDTGAAAGPSGDGAAGSPIACDAPAPSREDPVITENDAALDESDHGLVTVTLGNLYLLQGHRREAERIFRRLLRADPDDERARQGLARALGTATAPGRQEI